MMICTKRKLRHWGSFTYQLGAMVALTSGISNGSSALSITEDFTGTKTQHQWLMPPVGTYLTTEKPNSACLTAGTGYTQPNATLAGSPARCSEGNDRPGQGALRLTRNAGWQAGGIVSDFAFPTNDGVDITFTTYTWGGDGADGMAFMLLDATKPATLGATGGSLGYSCNNQHSNESGVIGGYLGIGIDEWGNFLNTYDNTNTGVVPAKPVASGNPTLPNAIGIRGAGSISYEYFADPTQFLQSVWTQNDWGTVPTNIADKWKHYWADFSQAQHSSNNYTMANICRTGTFTVPADYTATNQDLRLWSYDPSKPANQQPDAAHKIYNYPYLAHVQLANNLSTPFVGSRLQAKPITYKLKITPTGKLSVWVGYNGGTYQPIMLDEDIISKNGPLPPAFRFGFVGATGGSNNNHEVTCFKATPENISDGSVASNLPTETFKTGAQVYSATYNSLYWTGHVIAQSLVMDQAGKAFIQPLANWDGGCNLTGGQCATTDQTVTAQPQDQRSFWSWNGQQGIALNWNQLTPEQQAALQAANEADTSMGEARLAFLKGDRTQETPKGALRARSDVLADIINSSPVWVGYPDTEANKKYATYIKFANDYKKRTNVVYVGANDGFLHAFRSGHYDALDQFNTQSNDGKELFTYMPSAILARMYKNNNSLDYTHPQYAHNFYVDATPATGEVYYNQAWHTWLLGGLGAGGNTVYALDITDPDHFSASQVKGEWSYKNNTIWQHLGNSYGTPEFGRFRNGQWGAVFGNGWCSTTDEKNGNCTASAGPAGIYVMTLDQNTGTPSFQFLSTNSMGTVDEPNGIAYATPHDVDGDGMIDYVYAGDLKGQIWRFNLTGANWAQVKPQLLFKAVTDQGVAQPISTKILVSQQKKHIILNFGTGLKREGYLVNDNSYATDKQSIYGLKDDAALNNINIPSYKSGNMTAVIAKNQLLQQTVDPVTNALSQKSIDWQQSAGWYLDLPAVKVGDETEYEQIIWNPYIKDNILVVNTHLQSSSAVISCETAQSTGFTYALKSDSGAGLSNFWQSSTLPMGSYRQQLGASGTSQILWVNGHYYLLNKDRSGQLSMETITLGRMASLRRLSWREITEDL